jgi:hypothetical protein
MHVKNTKALYIACKIKQEIILFILKETEHYQYHQHNNGNCNYQQNGGLDKIIADYIANIPKTGLKPMFVETPPLPKD